MVENLRNFFSLSLLKLLNIEIKKNIAISEAIDIIMHYIKEWEENWKIKRWKESHLAFMQSVFILYILKFTHKLLKSLAEKGKIQWKHNWVSPINEFHLTLSQIKKCEILSILNYLSSFFSIHSATLVCVKEFHVEWKREEISTTKHTFRINP